MTKEIPIVLTQKIFEVQTKIVDIKKRWPAHSVKPDMVTQLDDLEDLLENLCKKLKEVSGESKGEVNGK